MTKDGKQIWVDKEFAKNLRKKWPGFSDRIKTKLLNKELEEMLYGKKK